MNATPLPPSTDPLSFQVSVKALIVDPAHRLLMLQEASGLWDLPGGRIEHGESPETGLQRECREEIGTSGPLLENRPATAWTILHDDGHWKLILCYRVALDLGELAAGWTASGECVQYGFFAPDELAALPLVRQMSPLRAQWRTWR